MSLQYISDTQGRHTAVVIPIEDWHTLTTRHQDLKSLESPKRKPSDFVGCISGETAQQMITDIERSRNEWERTI
jgi:extradiol dioxygenase family protein